MATLAEAVDVAETDWLVSADIPDTVDFLTVQSEVVQVTATFPAQYQARDGSTSDPRIRVVRAAGGTTAASHADGTTLTPLIPPSASGGGAAEPGTVVVTPPLQVDVAAALEGANAPDGANPLATLEDVATLGPVQVVTRTLTSAEILALHTSPVVLVPLQAGIVYVPLLASLVYHDGVTPYTYSGDLAVPPSLYWIGASLDSSMAGGPAAVMFTHLPGAGTGGQTTDGPTDLTIWATADSSPVDPTDGDGTIDVTVLYREVDVS